MTIKEAKERCNDIIETCKEGAEMHPYDKDLFLTDKLALETLLTEVNKVDKIREKLKELEQKEKQELKGLKGQDRYFVKQLYSVQKNLLNELLKES